ncbi:MAG: HD domain-containing protein [Bacteroidia bacterium]
METNRLLQQMAFLHEIDKLKYILRKTCLFHSSRHENDAEHSWHLCLMAITLAEYSPEPINLLKVLKMLLIHDLVEIDAGDTFLYDPARTTQHSAAEENAAHRIFGMLPDDQQHELYALWHEFETADNPDTRFARAIDRLQPVLQNLTNGGGTWKEHQIPLETILNKVAGIQKGSSTLWNYMVEAIETALTQGEITLGTALE